MSAFIAAAIVAGTPLSAKPSNKEVWAEMLKQTHRDCMSREIPKEFCDCIVAASKAQIKEDMVDLILADDPAATMAVTIQIGMIGEVCAQEYSEKHPHN